MHRAPRGQEFGGECARPLFDGFARAACQYVSEWQEVEPVHEKVGHLMCKRCTLSHWPGRMSSRLIECYARAVTWPPRSDRVDIGRSEVDPRYCHRPSAQDHRWLNPYVRNFDGFAE